MILVGIWFDLILILVLLISIIIGFKKGIFSVVKRFRTFIAAFLAWQLKLISPVKSLVGKIFHIDKEYFHTKMQTEFGDKLSENIHNTALSDAEKFDKTFGKLSGLLSDSKDYFMQRITEGADNLITDVTGYVANAVYDLIYGAIGFVLLFIIFFALFTVIYCIADKILNIGVLGFVNRLLGGALGAVTGMLWMWILSIIFVKLFPLILSTDAQTIAGGAIGLVKWFATKFFLSGIFGVTI